MNFKCSMFFTLQLCVYIIRVVHSCRRARTGRFSKLIHTAGETVTNIGRQGAVVEMQVLSYNVKQEAATSPTTESWFEARKCFHIIAIQRGSTD